MSEEIDRSIIEFNSSGFENDLVVSSVEIDGVWFTPTLYSKSRNAKIVYKQFYVRFGELPQEIQDKIEEIAKDKLSRQLELAKRRR